ncbi:tol-pal system protein YbgF [endosymbiont of unidentified scaly snail isolate Monju]|uniref:tol-pal system protein YbgF n=1 Tax=endosymbiont of unidentified scaly snail isolate Monju TaxID=1248727 RepID=UPI0003891B7E|nr:tol-pal system protein YbgF [endosymbiont of unidentified scaly snail isolate Monju]BAN69536.1 conserved hypothetical protein [endosymbiont of unidentified scaly snail isolate Monju]
MMRQRAVVMLGLLAVLSSAGLSAPQTGGVALEQRLERLERRAARITELTLAVDALRQENSRLRGEMERLQHELQQLRRQQRDLYLDIDQRLSSLQARPPAPAVTGDAPGGGAPAGNTGAGEPPAPAAVDPQRVQAEYQAAYALLSPRERRYAEAAAAFTEFLKKYPQVPLAANARYWLGEAYYVSQKNAEAKAAFHALIDKHPDSAKVPGALYKIGRILAAEGDTEGARKTFEQVVARYPDSPAANLAREQLKKLATRK